MRPSKLLNAYLLLAKQLNPVWRWALNKRIAAGKETAASVAQKLMIKPVARGDKPIIWGHAVGVGESLALAGLFEHLQQKLPDYQFLITSTARSATQALTNNQLNADAHAHWIHQCAPIDTPQVVDQFLDYWQPVMAIWCELDLWPALIIGSAQRRIPMALVNARLSPATLAKRLQLKSLYRPLLQSFDAIYSQNSFSDAGLTNLGDLTHLHAVSGSIKILGKPLGADLAQLAQWQLSVSNRPVWLFASSHDGEEALAFTVHQQLLLAEPNAVLIIAPRYPKRGDAITSASHICSFRTEQRSRRKDDTASGLDPAAQVYVADTIGEMGLWYRLAPAVLMGGTYSAVEGHNPFEAIVLGGHIIHGPHTANFSESFEDLCAQGLAVMQTDAQAIALTIQTIWNAKEANHRAPPAQPAAQSEPQSEPQIATKSTSNLAASFSPPISPAMQAMLVNLTGMIVSNTAHNTKTNLHDNTRPSI